MSNRIDDQAREVDLAFASGADFTLELTVTDPGGAVDMSTANIDAKLTDRLTGEDVISFTSAVSGTGNEIVTLSLTDEETAGLSGSYRWQTVVTREGDTRPWFAGTVHVSGLGDESPSAQVTQLSVRVDDINQIVVNIAATGAPGGGGGIPEAPNDGQPYVRQSLAWTDADTLYAPIGSGGANLDYTPAPSGGTVTSDSGTDATLTDVDGSNAGLMVPADKAKLDSIVVGDLLTQDGAQPDDLYVGVGTDTMSKVDGETVVGNLYEKHTKNNGAAITTEKADTASVATSHDIVATTPYHKLTMTGDTTLTVSGVSAAADTVTSFTVELTGAFTATWWAGIIQVGQAAAYDGTKANFYVLWTTDNGTTWYRTWMAEV